MPTSNIERWQTIYGEPAREWLDTLPSLVDYYAEKWELTINEPLEGGSVSVVLAATKGDEAVVLKIHPPWVKRPNGAPSTEAEVAAFRIWDGEGAPRLLASDAQALLLEYITPAEHSPELSAQEVATLVTQIARPVHPGSSALPGIPTIYDELLQRLYRAEASRHEAISPTLLMCATSMANYLAAVQGKRPRELIHGDFKAKNILKRPDGRFAVIDPNPAIGNRLYDVALWAIDRPETMLDRCAETAELLKVNPQIVGSLAVALAIPEICLASPGRAQRTLEQVQNVAGTDDLERYFLTDFPGDDFMGSPYTVRADIP